MLVAFPLTAAKIVGTDIFHAAILLTVAGAGHLLVGHVDLGATGWLLIGSVPGVLIGGRFTVALPDRALRIALAATLTLAGVKLVDPPGADAIVLAGGVAAAIAALVVAVRWLAGRSVGPGARPGEDPGPLERRRQRAGDESAAREAVPDLVGAAARAEAGCRREQRQRGDEQPERSLRPSSSPNAYASDAAVSTTSPTRFANRGGRASSSRPSPRRGCSTSK